MNYRNYLKDDILKFWLNHGMDTTDGGVLTCLDKSGNITGTEKNIKAYAEGKRRRRYGSDAT